MVERVCQPRRVWGHGTLRAIVMAFVSLALVALGPLGCSRVEYAIECPYGVSDEQFGRTMGNLLGPPIIAGNSVETLLNGDEIFPAMLGEIRGAKRSVTMETFVYWSGDVGKAFADALAERARAGVEVRVIIDAVGSASIDTKYLDEMHDAGVRVALYHALKWYDAVGSAQKINNRTHRKLLVVDGQTGFIGGVGIADEWKGHAQDKNHWRDTHFRVRGPVVAQLEAAFADNWMESTGEVLCDAAYFPALREEGSVRAQLFKSSYRGGNDSMHLMYLMSFAAARDSIRLATPYFVPDDLTTKTLVEARERGVAVSIIVPGPIIDERLVRKVSRSSWGPLLRAGIRIYEYQPTMYHAKLLVVDERWTSIGSSNLDPRSFGLNCEANLNVLDAGFAQRQTEVFESDLQSCHEITYEEWSDRPLLDRVFEPLTGLLGPQM